jgi:ABC-type glutathione transport system ATPase component
MSIPVLSVNIQARYRTKPILTDVCFNLHAGEALGLIGTSGAGKTTLVMALLGLLKWCGGEATGQVLVNGENLLTMTSREARRIRGKKIGLIPQSPMTSLNAAVSLRAHFDEAWRAHDTAGRRVLDARVAQLIQEVQLPPDSDFLRSRPAQISVGQAQRVLIALALLHNPPIVIADEPTSALDPVTQVEIINLLQRLNREHGTALLYISHDLVSVIRLCGRVAVLHRGTIVECLPIEQIAKSQHPATCALLGALPVPAEVLLTHRAIHADSQTGSLAEIRFAGTSVISDQVTCWAPDTTDVVESSPLM